MAKKELKLEDLNKVSGGAGSCKTYGPFHEGCGGRIDHVGNPFMACECRQCHEKHYWASDFKTYTINKISPSEYIYHYSNGSTKTVHTLPPEIQQWYM